MIESSHASSPAQRARQLIKDTGQRVTKPRLHTLTALLSTANTLSLADLRQQLPDMNRVSLYRALEWLLHHSLIFRLASNGRPHYGAEHSENHHQHPHFRCSVCGLTKCLSDNPLPHLDLPDGFLLHNVSLIATGTCNNCAKT